MSRKHKIILALLGFFIALVAARWINSPGYMDAEYYFVMGKVLASGEGWQEPFLWNYLDNPTGLPHPAFQYWMPFTSLLAALAQMIFGVSFRTAQIPFILLAASFPLFTSWIAFRLHGDPQMAWESGLLASVPGFFLPFWVTTDSFCIYGFVGPLIFLLSVEAAQKSGFAKWLVVGLLVGVAHGTRSDGLLFLFLAIGLIFYSLLDKRKSLAGLLTGYLIVMLPWWIINGIQTGYLFPSGMMRILWAQDYNELFSYPPDKLTFSRWIESGLGNILLARVVALWMNFKSLILVNGLVFLGPLMLIGGWRLRKDLIIRLVGIYLFLLFIVMSLIFPFAGSRGGYFHSSMAIMPILWVLVPIGLRRAIEWGVKFRHWDHKQASDIFVVAAFVLACLTTLGLFWSRAIGEDILHPVWSSGARTYQEATQWLENQGVKEAIVAVNNPPGFYTVSSLKAVVIPDGEPGVLRQVVDDFMVDWVLLDSNHPEGLRSLYENPEGVEWLQLRKTMMDAQGKQLFIYEVLKE